MVFRTSRANRGREEGDSARLPRRFAEDSTEQKTLLQVRLVRGARGLVLRVR